MGLIYIEKEIFKRAKPNPSALLSYGFVKDGDHYLYSRYIMDKAFKMEVEVISEGKVTSRLIDQDFGEEYTNFRLENQIGAFVNKVSEEHKEALLDIKGKCFEEIHFIGEQANRLTSAIKALYGDEPEFLWQDEPGFGIFRNPESQKWYAIIMNLDRGRLFKGEDGEIEVLNVKLNEEDIPSLIDNKHYFPAYHMNKKHWITIILDEGLPDEEILEKIAISHSFSNKKQYRKVNNDDL